ncbi:MAG TPA: type I methionyl aminopeptidase, partial [Acidobacteriaceae bacterium]|nr:type I methionyl aminopeptidase [Acidobacteriaceae bacterium]
MAIVIRTPQEIEKMRRSGIALRAVLHAVRAAVIAGSTTMDLERVAEAKIAEVGGISAFKGYHGYPRTLCTSINSEVVHGIPSKKNKLREGDVVSIDCGVVIDGYYSDSALTVPVGKVAPVVEKLLQVTESSLESAIQSVHVGAYLGDVGAAVQDVVEAAGFSVVREFVGHGIGTSMHEDPQVPNYGRRGIGIKLREGMVLAIEPMVNVGKPE